MDDAWQGRGACGYRTFRSNETSEPTDLCYHSCQEKKARAVTHACGILPISRHQVHQASSVKHAGVGQESTDPLGGVPGQDFPSDSLEDMDGLDEIDSRFSSDPSRMSKPCDCGRSPSCHSCRYRISNIGYQISNIVHEISYEYYSRSKVSVCLALVPTPQMCPRKY